MTLKTFIRQSITELQRKVADWLDTKINKFTPRQKRTGFVIFGLSVGLFCLFLVFGVVGTDESGNALQVDSITLPKDIHPSRLDSIRTWPSKAVDSLQSIFRKLYHDHSY